MFKKQSPVRKKAKAKPKRLIMDPSKRMLLKQLVIGVGVFVVAGIVLAGVWYGSRVEVLTLTTVTAKGGETIDVERVKKVAEGPLEGTYMGIIPRDFAWLYPEDDIYAALNTIPRIKNPVVTRTSGTELSVTYDEFIPYALWCDEVNVEDCLFFDKVGYAFGKAPQLTGGALIRYRTIGVKPTVGQSVLSVENIEHIRTFINLIEKGKRFEIAAVEIDTAGDVFYIVASGGEFKSSLRDDPATVYDNLMTIISDKNFTDIEPGTFQYIDLRFGSKVYVKKEETTIASSTTATSTAASE